MPDTLQIDRPTLQAGLRSPRAMAARALEIERLCGGTPSRADLVNPTPRIRAAWAAHKCSNQLYHARWNFRFLHQSRLSVRWLYRSYTQDRRIAQACLRGAATFLREAEGILATMPANREAA